MTMKRHVEERLLPEGAWGLPQKWPKVADFACLSSIRTQVYAGGVGKRDICCSRLGIQRCTSIEWSDTSGLRFAARTGSHGPRRSTSTSTGARWAIDIL